MKSDLMSFVVKNNFDKLIDSKFTQTLKRTFLYVTVSTLKPTVGMVVTGWPDFNLYRIAVKKENGAVVVKDEARRW